MKKTNKFLSLFLAALLVLSYSVLPASAASLKAVTNLKAYNIDDDEINLSWSAVTSADGYQVYIYNEASGKWQKLANTSKTFAITSAPPLSSSMIISPMPKPVCRPSDFRLIITMAKTARQKPAA